MSKRPVDQRSSSTAFDGSTAKRIKVTDTAALEVDNVSGAAYFTVDTSNGVITIGNTTNGCNVRLANPVTGTSSLFFNDGSDVGRIVYNHTSDTLSLYAGGIDVADLTGSGLTINQGTTINAASTVSNTSHSTFIVRRGSAGTVMFQIDALNNFASFGASSAALDIRSITTASGINNVYFNNGSTDNGLIKFDHSVASGGRMTLQTNATDRIKIDSNGALFVNPITLPSYTVATIPAATTVGRVVYVSDDAIGPTLAISDGTNWRRLNDLAVCSTSNTTLNSELKEVVDVTDTAAFTVRKNGATGDIFVVDTSGNNVNVGSASAASKALITSSSASALKVQTTGGFQSFNVAASNSLVDIGSTNASGFSGALRLNGVAATSGLPIDFYDGTTNKGQIMYDLGTDTLAFTVGASAVPVITLDSRGLKGLPVFLYQLTADNNTTAVFALGDSSTPCSQVFNRGTAFAIQNTTTGKITINEGGVYLIGYTLFVSNFAGTTVELSGAIQQNALSGVADTYATASPQSKHASVSASILMLLNASDTIALNVFVIGVPLSTYNFDLTKNQFWGYKISS